MRPSANSIWPIWNAWLRTRGCNRFARACALLICLPVIGCQTLTAPRQIPLTVPAASPQELTDFAAEKSRSAIEREESQSSTTASSAVSNRFSGNDDQLNGAVQLVSSTNSAISGDSSATLCRSGNECEAVCEDCDATSDCCVVENPCCDVPIFSFEDDRKAFGSILRDDARAILNCDNIAILGVALGGAIAIRQDLDGQVRDNVARQPERWGDASRVLGNMGEIQYQLPVLLGLYGISLKTQDSHLHQLNTSLMSAYTITGLSTMAIKGIANTDRPSEKWNGGHFGFPSFHVSSSFTIAAVLDEYEGPMIGIPAYALAGLIGWSRIDERDHDLSDVVFGAALGYVVGKSVAGHHLYGDSRVRLLPYVHPTEGSSGVMVDLAF